MAARWGYQRPALRIGPRRSASSARPLSASTPTPRRARRSSPRSEKGCAGGRLNTRPGTEVVRSARSTIARGGDWPALRRSALASRASGPSKLLVSLARFRSVAPQPVEGNAEAEVGVDEDGGVAGIAGRDCAGEIGFGKKGQKPGGTQLQAEGERRVQGQVFLVIAQLSNGEYASPMCWMTAGGLSPNCAPPRTIVLLSASVSSRWRVDAST